ncbi:MAG: PilZ domain-containing protein [Gammaproteobacteria bacterium]
MKDRRQFYRIDDMISLNYKVVRPSDAKGEIEKPRLGYTELADLRNALYCIDARLDDISNQLSKDNPLIAELATLINKKIVLHARMTGFHADEDDEQNLSPACKVNLSANGVAFETEAPLPDGAALRLELVTYPEVHYIPVYARVVSCRKNEEPGQTGYTIAVEFEAMSEKDRERIIHHVFSRQAQELRGEREVKGPE